MHPHRARIVGRFKKRDAVDFMVKEGSGESHGDSVLEEARKVG